MLNEDGQLGLGHNDYPGDRIYQDIQLIKPNSQVLFIRFNPDAYKGVQHNIRERHKYLHTIVTQCINLPTIGVPLGQIKLFYDGFNGEPKIEPIELTKTLALNVNFQKYRQQ